MTTSRAPSAAGELDHLVEHRDGHVQALDRELLLAQVGLVHEALERVDLRQAAQQRLLLLVGQRRAEGARSRSSRAARCAGGARRCARSRRRSCRSRSRAGAGARRPASRPGRRCAGSWPGSCAMISGVRPSGSGSSAGSPSGSEPSGSSCAARWPCVRCALISDIAAWTACSSSSVGLGGAAPAPARSVRRAAAAAAAGAGAVRRRRRAPRRGRRRPARRSRARPAGRPRRPAGTGRTRRPG